MKLLRTIRLDPSDTFVFERAAEPGEWAVPGSFMFWDTDVESLDGKPRAAFRGGFLGIGSFGWSTLVQVVETGERPHVTDLLARQLVARLGAPDIGAARKAAEEEIAFAASLCDHPPNTLIAVHRRIEHGEVREAFRTLRPRGDVRPMRAFSFLHVEGEEDEQPAETVDLAALAQDKRP